MRLVRFQEFAENQPVLLRGRKEPFCDPCVAESCFNLGSAPHPNMYDVYGLNAITLLQESSPVVCISHKVLGVCD